MIFDHHLSVGEYIIILHGTATTKLTHSSDKNVDIGYLLYIVDSTTQSYKKCNKQ